MPQIREIVFDTETTGFDPASGDRVVEIGALELINHLPTDNQFHTYINPQRDMPEGAFSVHGLSEEFLSDKPLFADIAAQFLEFIGDDVLIAHNASFDIKFMNAELTQANLPILSFDRVIDTLALAKKKHPAGPNSLDALCKRYGIDNRMRDLHGALLDSELLAGVYLELIGGRQRTLVLASQETKATARKTIRKRKVLSRPSPLPSRLSEEEKQAHKSFLATFHTETVWNKFSKPD